MDHVINSKEEFEGKYYYVKPGDCLVMRKCLYYSIKDKVRALANGMVCGEQLIESPDNVFPGKDGQGVSVHLFPRLKEIKELNYYDMLGEWIRQDTGALYKFNTSTGIATKGALTKVFDWKFELASTRNKM